MNVKNLTKLADFADTLGDKLIDMGQWNQCIVGLAAHAGVFRGLVMDKDANAIDYTRASVRRADWDAVCALFDIDIYVANRLFGSNLSRGLFTTGPAVAAEVRALINKEKAETQALYDELTTEV